MNENARFFAPLLLLFLLSGTMLLAGCASSSDSSDDPAENADAVRLRLHNGTDLDFSSATVRFPEEEQDFGAIEAGESSAYRTFENAYRYASITVEADGETYEVRAIDYMGEQPLQSGRYTYRLDIVDGSLEMEFEQND